MTRKDGRLLLVPMTPGASVVTFDGEPITNLSHGFIRVWAIEREKGGFGVFYIRSTTPLLFRGPGGPFVACPSEAPRCPVLAILHEDHSLAMMVTDDPSGILATQTWLHQEAA